MRILITGAAGFVGSSLAKYIVNAVENVEIWGMDNLIRPGSHLNVSKLKELGVNFLHGDIREASDLENLPEVDFVIDAAANASVLAGIDGKTSSRQLVEHNLQGTINMLEYCKKVGAGFILLSTSRVYSISPLANLKVAESQGAFIPVADQSFPTGLSVNGVSEDFDTKPPISLYGSTKIASEYLALEYGESFNIPVWINRCGVMAGPGQFGHPAQGIFAFWVHSFAEKSALKYIGFGGDGHQVRDCLHPFDLGKLLIQQIAEPLQTDKPRLINVSGGIKNSMSLKQLTEWSSERFQPMQIEKQSEDRKFDIPWMVLDNSSALNTWGWFPNFCVEEILEEIAGHAEENPDWLSISKA
ncbi:MAG: NAD-dependent epimerase/dehydratase family protein [Verrucomicrobia bacterium]|nr:NAD-dependent epimerase/dehydratase family protein [Verrucomicrobiota bacterium]MDA1066502.1 NAD-dependent epimerase/dehydratase family protein [Verrucomicrobiota bacterium]